MDIIPPLVKTGKVFAYRHNAYWADLSTLDAYWKANLDLLEDGQASNLLDPAWMLQDFWSSTVPANIRPGGVVKNSLVSEGCVIAGAVEHSVLSPGVRVEKGAIVRDSVILHDAVIHRGAIVNRCVVDNFAEIAAETKVGVNAGQTASHPQPGITFIGK
jgi:glucose-1-phosphate adenylyltransferase